VEGKLQVQALIDSDWVPAAETGLFNFRYLLRIYFTNWISGSHLAVNVYCGKTTTHPIFAP